MGPELHIYQMFQMYVLKVDLDVAYVAMAIQVCCKCMFQIFELFQRYVVSVLSGCCICCTGNTRMLQVYVSNVSAIF